MGLALNALVVGQNQERDATMKRFFGKGHVNTSKAATRLRFPALTEVETYWQALRSRHHVPLRADLDPRGIRGALSKAFVLECSDPEEPRFRIVGSDIIELYQNDLGGRPLTDLVVSHRRSAIQDVIRDVCRLPAQVQMDLSVPKITGDVLELRMVLLPMKDASGQRSRILGCLDFDTAGQLPNVSVHGLEPTGSIVRPLGAEHHAIERRMKHPELVLVSSEDRPRRRKGTGQKSPKLRLVEI